MAGQPRPDGHGGARTAGGRTARRRRLAAIAVTGAMAVALAACSGRSHDAGPAGASGGPEEEEKKPEEGAGAPEKTEPRLIGDGSTSFTGPQPNQPEAAALAPGETPPQFVVFSWDGAGEDGNKLFSHFREVARENDAHMTYFLTGIYLLPEDKAHLYEPPGRAPGASDIGYLKDENIAATLEQLRGAWLDGSEIGTHFNGHFCGPTGVDSWSPEDWRSETEQARWMVQNWRTTTGWDDAEPLPFDYDRELAGGRTPCLEGQANLLKVAADMGFRYDSSGNGRQVWPSRREGVWDIPLQQVPVPGWSFETLAMDYNFMVNQSGGPDGDPARYPHWQEQMRDGLLAGFERAYHGNRAPLIIGNHFNQWNGGIYMDAVQETIEEICPKEDVRCVSFRQLVDWLDAQDPAVLDKLRTLDVGQAPAEGWETFLGAAGTGAGTAGAGAGTPTDTEGTAEGTAEGDTETAGATAGTASGDTAGDTAGATAGG
ncbi:hypothetical protein [Streptomyces sp. YIM 98790]|uniref:hypothetical protein n=1 Tax=Streptomyces sp. YIM 98790 TaxID=2689077 RepID=UPI0037DD96B6